MTNHEDVAIFWDYENCRPPSSAAGHETVNGIRGMAHEFGIVTTWKAYLDLSDPAPARSPNIRSELQSSGVSLVDCPRNGRKDVADKMMIVDMVTYALDKPQPGTIILISGDRDFAYAVSVLRMRKWAVVVVMPQVNGHDSMRYTASVVLDWGACVTVKSDKPRQSRAPPARPRSLTDSTFTGSTLIKSDRRTDAPLERLGPTGDAPITSCLVREEMESCITTLSRFAPRLRELSQPLAYAGCTSSHTASIMQSKDAQPSDSCNSVAAGEEVPAHTKTFANKSVETTRRLFETLGVQTPESFRYDLVRNSEWMSTPMVERDDGIGDCTPSSGGFSPRADSDFARIEDSPRSRANYMSWLDGYEEEVAPSQTVTAVPSSPSCKVTFVGWSSDDEHTQDSLDRRETPQSSEGLTATKDMLTIAADYCGNRRAESGPSTPLSVVPQRPLFVSKPFQGPLIGSLSAPVSPTRESPLPRCILTVDAEKSAPPPPRAPDDIPLSTKSDDHIAHSATSPPKDLRDSDADLPRANVQVQEEATVPARFKPLVDLLQKLELSGHRRPTLAMVGEQMKNKSAVYLAAGVGRLKDYVNLAHQAGIVDAGGPSKGGEWVGLPAAKRGPESASSAVGMMAPLSPGGKAVSVRLAFGGGTKSDDYTAPSTTSTLKASHDNHCDLPCAKDQVPEAPIVPVHFKPLVALLEKLQLSGLKRPMLSQVGCQMENKLAAYEGSGVKRLKDYVVLAQKAGIVEIGGPSCGGEWVALTAACNGKKSARSAIGTSAPGSKVTSMGRALGEERNQDTPDRREIPQSSAVSRIMSTPPADYRHRYMTSGPSTHSSVFSESSISNALEGDSNRPISAPVMPKESSADFALMVNVEMFATAPSSPVQAQTLLSTRLRDDHIAPSTTTSPKAPLDNHAEIPCAKDQAPQAVVPAHFKVLIDILANQHLAGINRPSLGLTEYMLRTKGFVYEGAGISTLKDYLDLAQKAGVVEMGILPGGRDCVTLTAAWWPRGEKYS